MSLNPAPLNTTRRRALLALLIAGGGSSPVSAGCLDWLFGRNTTVNPQAVNLPATSVTANGLPAGQPFVSPGVVAPASDFSSSTYSANFGAVNQATAAQWPAYGSIPTPINNPSVLTGQPVNPGVASGPFSAFRTTINPALVAQPGFQTLPQTSYNAAAAYQAPAVNNGFVHPLQTQPVAPATGGGLLGKIFGNQYRTQYNNVPTTVYRPVQQIDPATGQVVIVQQPCTTNTQQVQRTPYTSLQPAPAAVAPAPRYGEPGCGGETPGYSQQQPYSQQSQYSQQPYPQQQQPQYPQQPQYSQQQYSQQQQYPQQQYTQQPQYAPQADPPSQGSDSLGSGVAPAAAWDSGPNGSGGYVSPIPSTDPAPLQGNPDGYQNESRPEPPADNGPATDSTPVAPPQLPDSGENSVRYEPERGSTSTPSSTVSTKYSDLPPIPATDDYQPPRWDEPDSQPHGGQPSRTPPSPAQPSPRISPPSWNDRTASRVIEPSDTRGTGFNGAASGRAVSHSEWDRAFPQSEQPPTRRPADRRDDGGWVPLGQ